MPLASSSRPAQFDEYFAVADAGRYFPERVAKAAVAEGQAICAQVLEKLRDDPAPPSIEVLTNAMERLQALEETTFEPDLDTSVSLVLALWRLLARCDAGGAVAPYGYANRRGFLWHMKTWLQGIDRRLTSPDWLVVEAEQSANSEQLQRLSAAFDLRLVLRMIFREAGSSRRILSGVRDSERNGLISELIELLSYMRRFKDAAELESAVLEVAEQLDGRYSHVMLFTRIIIVLYPRVSASKLIASGRLWQWWSSMPEGLVPKFDLMWFAILARYAKQRWMSEPSAEDTAAGAALRTHLPWILNKAYRVLQLPLCSPSVSGLNCAKELSAVPSADRFSIPGAIDVVATGRVTNWSKFAKFVIYSLAGEPSAQVGTPDPAGPEVDPADAWSWLALLLRQLRVFLQPGGASGDWQYHSFTLIRYLIGHYYKRVTRERLLDTKVPTANRLSRAADKKFVELVLPLVKNCLKVEYHMIMVQTIMLFADLAHLDAWSAPALEGGMCEQLFSVDVPSMLSKAIEDLNDPEQSGRHASLFQMFGRSLQPVLLRWPGFLNELLPVTLWGIDVTDIPKTVSSLSLISAIFANVPCVDLDGWSSLGPSELQAGNGKLDRRRWAVPGACDPSCDDESSALCLSSMLPSFALDYMQRVFEFIGLMPKPTKGGGLMDDLEAVSLGLLHTATYLIAAQCSKSTFSQLVEALRDFISTNLLVDQLKAVTALTSAMVRVNPAGAVPILVPRLLKKLLPAGTTGRSQKLSADLSGSEAKWYLSVAIAVVRHSGTALLEHREALESVMRGALADEREDVSKLGAKLLRRLLFAITGTYVASDFRICNETTWGKLIDSSASEDGKWPLRWWGWTSPWWAHETPKIEWHEPTEREALWAKDLVQGSFVQATQLLPCGKPPEAWKEPHWLDGFEIPAKKPASYSIKTALSIVRAALRGTCGLWFDDRSDDELKAKILPVVSPYESLGRAFFEQFARLLQACARSLSKEECAAAHADGFDLPSGVDQVEVPGLLTGVFDCIKSLMRVACSSSASARIIASNLRGDARSRGMLNVLLQTDQTPAEVVHEDSRMRELPRFWWVLDVADAMDVRHSHRCWEHEYAGWRKDTLDLLTTFALRSATESVRSAALGLLRDAVPCHVASGQCAEVPVLWDPAMAALAEETEAVKRSSSLPPEKVDAEELRLNNALEGVANVFSNDTFLPAVWREGTVKASAALVALAECLYAITRASGDAVAAKEKNSKSCEVKPRTLSRVVVAAQRILDHRDIQCQATLRSDSNGFSEQRWVEVMENISQVLGICARSSCHWKTQVMCTGIVLSLQGVMQHVDVPAGKAEMARGVWLQMLKWFQTCCEPKGVPTLQNLGALGICLQVRKPSTPLRSDDLRASGLLERSFLEKLIDVLTRRNHSALLSGGSSADSNDATAGLVRVVASGGLQGSWPFSWASSASSTFSVGNALFWQSYVQLYSNNGSAPAKELSSTLLFAAEFLAGKPTSEPEAHVTLIELFAGAMRALRYDNCAAARADAWSALHTVLRSELQRASQERCADWCTALRFIAAGTAQPQLRSFLRKLSPEAAAAANAPCSEQFLIPLFNFALNSEEAPSPEVLAKSIPAVAVSADATADATAGIEEGSSFTTFKRLRLLVALLAEPAAASMLTSAEGDVAAKQALCLSVLDALWPGLGHPYKQLREEAARSVVLLLSALCGPLGRAGDVARAIQDRLAREAERLQLPLREDNNGRARGGATNSAEEEKAGTRKPHVLESSGVCYVLLHAALGRLTPVLLNGTIPRCVAFLLAAATHSDFELRVLAASALASCSAAHLANPVLQGDTPWHNIALVTAIAESLRLRAADADADGLLYKEREKALFLSARPLLVANAFALRLQPSSPNEARLLDALRSLVEEALGDSHHEVRNAAKGVWITVASSDTPAAARGHLDRFRRWAPPPKRRKAAEPGTGAVASTAVPRELLAGVVGYSCLLSNAADLGAPDWVGEVVESIAPYGRTGTAEAARTEVQGVIQTFLKAQQMKQEIWKEFQAKLSRTQLDLLNEYKGKLTYFS